MAVAFVKIFLLVAFIGSCALLECKGSSYHKVLKDALLSDDENQENLTRSFFHTNHPKRITADIYYAIRCTNFSDYTTISFRWSLSPINLIIDPKLLKILSLFTFHMDSPEVNLTLDLQQDDCDIPDIDETTCNKEDGIIGALNDLTSNMQFYAKRPKSSDKMDYSSDNLDYSVLVYDESSYCVLNQIPNYYWSKIALHVAICSLLLFFITGTPTLLVGVYGRFREKMDKHDQSLRYIVWAVAILTLLLTPTLIGIDLRLWYTHKQLLPLSIGVDFELAATITCLVSFIVVPAIVILGMIRVNRNSSKEEKLSEFPIPNAFFVWVCEACCKFCAKYVKWVLIFVASVAFIDFLVLVGFHGTYMVLGVVAAPKVALVQVAFYIAAPTFIVGFIAVTLRLSDKSTCDKNCTQKQDKTNPHTIDGEETKGDKTNPHTTIEIDGEETKGDKTNPHTIIEIDEEEVKGDNNNCCFNVVLNCFFGMLQFLSALSLCITVIAFGAFQYFFSTMVHYQDNGDFLSILGLFLPTALLTFATYCINRLMDNCLNDSNLDKKDGANSDKKDGDNSDKKDAGKKDGDISGKKDGDNSGKKDDDKSNKKDDNLNKKSGSTSSNPTSASAALKIKEEEPKHKPLSSDHTPSSNPVDEQEASVCYKRHKKLRKSTEETEKLVKADVHSYNSIT